MSHAGHSTGQPEFWEGIVETIEEAKAEIAELEELEEDVIELPGVIDVPALEPQPAKVPKKPAPGAPPTQWQIAAAGMVPTVRKPQWVPWTVFAAIAGLAGIWWYATQRSK